MTPHDSPFVGRFIRVKLCFPQLDQYNRKIRGHITLFVTSVYHPVDEVEHADFTDTLSSIMTSVPKLAEFIGRHDVNANLGISTKMYRKTLGPWGIDNHNMKRRIIIWFFSQHRLKVTNRFYKKPPLVTWRLFGNSKSPHMLDVISVSETFFKCVRNCGVSPRGM